MGTTSDLDRTAFRSGEVRTRKEEETAAAAAAAGKGEVRSVRSVAGTLAGGGMELWKESRLHPYFIAIFQKTPSCLVDCYRSIFSHFEIEFRAGKKRWCSVLPLFI